MQNCEFFTNFLYSYFNNISAKFNSNPEKTLNEINFIKYFFSIFQELKQCNVPYDFSKIISLIESGNVNQILLEIPHAGLYFKFFPARSVCEEFIRVLENPLYIVNESIFNRKFNLSNYKNQFICTHTSEQIENAIISALVNVSINGFLLHIYSIYNQNYEIHVTKSLSHIGLAQKYILIIDKHNIPTYNVFANFEQDLNYINRKVNINLIDRKFTYQAYVDFINLFVQHMSVLENPIVMMEIDDDYEMDNIKYISSTVKKLVWKKWIGDLTKTKCQYCNLFDIDVFDFDCAYIIPKALGGKVDVQNLRPICRICKSNGKKYL